MQGSAASSEPTVVAVFDFDETLTTKHSLRPFLCDVVGNVPWFAGILRSSRWLVASAVRSWPTGRLVALPRTAPG